jgi:hypothetical protein
LLLPNQQLRTYKPHTYICRVDAIMHNPENTVIENKDRFLLDLDPLLAGESNFP